MDVLTVSYPGEPPVHEQKPKYPVESFFLHYEYRDSINHTLPCCCNQCQFFNREHEPKRLHNNAYIIVSRNKIHITLGLVPERLTTFSFLRQFCM